MAHEPTHVIQQAALSNNSVMITQCQQSKEQIIGVIETPGA